MVPDLNNNNFNTSYRLRDFIFIIHLVMAITNADF